MSPSRREFKVRVRYLKPGARIPEEHLIEKFPCSIGRGSDCDLSLGDSSISSQHALLEWDQEKGQLVVRDLGSRNGTRNGVGEKMMQVPLGEGVARLMFGTLEVDFEILRDGNLDAGEKTRLVDEAAFQKRGSGVPDSKGPSADSNSGVSIRTGRLHSTKGRTGIRSLRIREPTGGIKIDRAAFRFSRDAGGNSPKLGDVFFEKRRADALGISQGRRALDSGYFALGSVALFVGAGLGAFASKEDTSFQPFTDPIGTGLIYLQILLGAGVFVSIYVLFCTGTRFLKKRGDIDFVVLWKQLFGAVSFSAAFHLASLFFDERALVSDLPHGWTFWILGSFLARLGTWYFSFYTLTLLRSREGEPGVWVRSGPQFLALPIAVLSVYSLLSGADSSQVRPLDFLTARPTVAPFAPRGGGGSVSEQPVSGVEEVVAQLDSASLEIQTSQKTEEKGRTPAMGGE